MKILVAAVASGVLGDDFRYTTRGRGPRLRVRRDQRRCLPSRRRRPGALWRLARSPISTAPGVHHVARRPPASGGGGRRRSTATCSATAAATTMSCTPGWGADVNGSKPCRRCSERRPRAGRRPAGQRPGRGGARVRANPRRAGIAVTGGWNAPHRRAQNWQPCSHTAARGIAEMLTNSDNNSAEMMLKEIGLAAPGGNPPAGADAPRRRSPVGASTRPVVVADGSGLSSDDRITCRTMILCCSTPASIAPSARASRSAARPAHSPTLATPASPVVSAARPARSTTSRTTRTRRR